MRVRLFFQWIAFITVAISLASVLAIWSLYTAYSAARTNIFHELDRSLAAYHLTLDCSDYWEWPKLTQKEYCSVRADGQQVVFFRQQVRFSPLALNADFTVNPVYKGMHFDGQSGQWTLPIGGKRIEFDAYTEGAINTRRVEIDPWRFSGWIELAPPFDSHFSASFDHLLIELQSEQLSLDGLSITIEPRLLNLNLNQLKLESNGEKFSIRGLEVSGRSNQLKSGNLTVLANSQFKQAKVQTNTADLNIQPTQLQYELEGVELNLIKLFKSMTAAVNISINLKRFFHELIEQLNARPYQLNLSNLTSALDYRVDGDSTNTIAGDFVAQGWFSKTAEDVLFRLAIEANESFYNESQSSMIDELIDLGWIKRETGRLIAELEYKDETLQSNGELVSAFKIWPKQ